MASPYTTTARPIAALTALLRGFTAVAYRRCAVGGLWLAAEVAAVVLIRHRVAWAACAVLALLTITTLIANLVFALRGLPRFAAFLTREPGSLRWVHAGTEKRGLRTVEVRLVNGTRIEVFGPVAEVEAVLDELRGWTAPPQLTTSDPQRAAELPLFENETAIVEALEALSSPQLFPGEAATPVREALRAIQAVHRHHPTAAPRVKELVGDIALKIAAQQQLVRHRQRRPEVYGRISFEDDARDAAERLTELVESLNAKT